MADSEAANNERSFEEHPLYHLAMEKMAAGDQAGAVVELQQLVEIFPEEPRLRDLLVRTELRTTVTMPEREPKVHGAPAPMLRAVLLVLSAVVVCLVGTVGFAAAYDAIIKPSKEELQRALYLSSLRQECQWLLEAGAWPKAREACQDLLDELPGDPEAEGHIRFSYQQEAWDQQYDEAVSAQQRGDLETALNLLRQIGDQHLKIAEVRQLIKTLEEQVALADLWQQGVALFDAGDCSGAQGVLEEVRSRDPDRRSQAEALLWQCYTRFSRELIDRARGSPDVLREAIGYLDRALQLQPYNEEWREERGWAVGFVSGAEAADRGDWAGAVAAWEPVHETRPDYQSGVLERNLHQAYGRAAKQLIDQANGDAGLLQQAIDYIDRAGQPDNEEMIALRYLAAEFVAGAKALAKGYLKETLVHWGAVYAIDPDYQNGVLRDRVRQVCETNPEADADLCPP